MNQFKAKLLAVMATAGLLVSACGQSSGTTGTSATAAPATGGGAAATTSAGGAASGGATAGTGNCATSGPKVDKLTFWTRAAEGEGAAGLEFSSLKKMADAYTAQTGTPVELVTVPDADFKSKMSISSPAGEGPDVYGPIAHDWIGEFAIQKIALEIPDSAIKDKSDFLQSTLDAATMDGKLYAMPLFAESVALIYNKKLVPTPPKTWDEFVKVATDQTKGDVYGFGFPLLEQYHEGAFFMGFGGYIFKYDNGKFNTDDIGLNNEGSVQAAKFLRDMYQKKQPPLPEVAVDRANMHAQQEGMMEAGKIAMTINGPWREAPLKAAGIDYGVAKLPTLPNGQAMKPFVGVQVFGANAFSKNKEAALDFISFATCTDSAVTLFPSNNRAPARKSVLSNDVVKSNPNVAVWNDQAAEGVPMPNIPAMSNVWKPWGDAMDSIIPANAPDDQVKTLLDNAVAQIKTAVQQTK